MPVFKIHTYTGDKSSNGQRLNRILFLPKHFSLNYETLKQKKNKIKKYIYINKNLGGTLLCE